MATVVVQAPPVVSQSALTGVGSRIGGQLQQRLAAMKVKYTRERGAVAEEIGKLSQTHPPSRFAFAVIFLLGISIDILNYVVDVTIVGDLILSVIFLLCVRAMINRSKGAQRFLAGALLVALGISVIIPVIGSLFGGPLLMVVLAAGLFNKGVKVQNVDKEKITQSIQRFEQTVRAARTYAARLVKFGRKTRGLRTLTTKLARSKAFKTFSKSSKTTSRLAASAVAEAIPFIAWIPFNTLNVFLTYRDLKRGHAEAVEMLAEYQEQEANALSIESSLLQEQYTRQMTQVAAVVANAQRALDETTGFRTTQQSSSPSTPSAPRQAPPVRPVLRDVTPRAAVASPSAAAA